MQTDALDFAAETNTLKLVTKSGAENCQILFFRMLNKNVVIDPQAEFSFSSTAAGLIATSLVDWIVQMQEKHAHKIPILL